MDGTKKIRQSGSLTETVTGTPLKVTVLSSIPSPVITTAVVGGPQVVLISMF
jgi:hypothetical protein